MATTKYDVKSPSYGQKLEQDRKVCALGASSADFHEKVEYPHPCAFMNHICVPGPLKRGKEAENANGVGIVVHLPLQVYLEMLRHLCHST